jgi:hypothetical protein
MPAAAKPKTLAVESPAAAAATKTATPVKESAPTPDTPKVPYLLCRLFVTRTICIFDTKAFIMLFGPRFFVVTF